MDILYIIMPAYNEEENIRSVIEDWYPVIEAHDGGGRSRLVILDDGSRDRTFEIMKQCTEGRPLFCPLTKKNEGHGATVLCGYQYALDHGADFIFQTDSDGQTLASEFAPFWEKRNQEDMVIGDRSRRQDGFSRILVTKVLKAVIRRKFHVSVKDANTPYRLMRADVLREEIRLVPEKFNLANVLLTVIYTKKKRSVAYLPITFRPRQGGKNSINFKNIIRIGRQALSDFGEINRTIEAGGEGR